MTPATDGGSCPKLDPTAITVHLHRVLFAFPVNFRVMAFMFAALWLNISTAATVAGAVYLRQCVLSASLRNRDDSRVKAASATMYALFHSFKPWHVIALLGLRCAAGAYAGDDDFAISRIDSGERSLLNAHNPAWARATNDVGSVPGGFALDHLSVVLRRSAVRQLAYDRLLQEQ